MLETIRDYGLERLSSYGELEAALWEAVGHPNLGLVFDAGNLVCQGYDAGGVFAQYLAMKPGLLWIHVKDYRNPRRNSAARRLPR